MPCLLFDPSCTNVGQNYGFEEVDFQKLCFCVVLKAKEENGRFKRPSRYFAAKT